ncbi:MAG: hypothetical protein WC350_04880 [Candidatus Micrarchaeia archaeon]|jgi:hypothetical protein
MAKKERKVEAGETVYTVLRYVDKEAVCLDLYAVRDNRLVEFVYLLGKEQDDAFWNEFWYDQEKKGYWTSGTDITGRGLVKEISNVLFGDMDALEHKTI